MAKILKDGAYRSKYHHWLENGIPYWRGRGYYFRKSENLSILQSLVIILGGFSVMQYVSMFVRYLQVKSGLVILESYRERAAIVKSLNSGPAASLSKKAKQELRKRKSSSDQALNDSQGIFDDANMKQALDYLVLQKHIEPEVCLDNDEWKSLINDEFGNDETRLIPPFPKPWHTVMFWPITALLSRLTAGSPKSVSGHQE